MAWSIRPSLRGAGASESVATTALLAREALLFETAVVVVALTVVFVVTVAVVLVLVMRLAVGWLGIRSGRAGAAFNEGDLRLLSPTGGCCFAATAAAALLARAAFSFPKGTYKQCQYEF